MSNPLEAADHIQPIIIKRKKVVGGDGHHGGAWKVAYADFVTAMMAFFLLMWLLNATTEEQRKGIADYFNPTIPVSRISGGGSDGLNGSSIFTEETYAKDGLGGARKQSATAPRASEASTASKDEVAEQLKDLKSQIGDLDGELSEHVKIKLSPEGIVMELVDSEDSPLFPVGLSEPTALMASLLPIVSGSFDKFDNEIKIVGHTDSLQYKARGGYDNWNLSSDRANTARRLLTANGVPVGRIREVSGKADTELLIPEDPTAAQNRRISLVILTN
ncbi:MAG: flagellar motor protein MotB [Pseudomonadota bacterium]